MKKFVSCNINWLGIIVAFIGINCSISYAGFTPQSSSFTLPPYASEKQPIMKKSNPQENQPYSVNFPVFQFEDMYTQGMVNFYEDIYDEQSGLFLDAPGAQSAATGSLGFSVATVTTLSQQGIFNKEKWLPRLARTVEDIFFIQSNQPRGDWLKILRDGKSILTVQIMLDKSKEKMRQLNEDSDLDYNSRLEQMVTYIKELDFNKIAKEEYGWDVVSDKITPTVEEIGLVFGSDKQGRLQFAVSQKDIDAVKNYGYDGWLGHYLAKDLTLSGLNTELSSVDTALTLAGLLYLAAAYGDYEYKAEDGTTHTLYDRVDDILMNVNMESAQFYNAGTNRFPHGWAPYTGGLGGDYWGDEEILLHLIKALQHPEEGVKLPLDAMKKHMGSYITPNPEKYGYFVSYQATIWTDVYAHDFFDLYHFSVNGVDWHKNSKYGITDNHQYAITEGNTLGGNIGYYPFDAWISTNEAYGTPEDSEAGFQMHYGAKPGWTGKLVNDGSFSPYAPLSALPYLPFQALQSVLYHYNLTPELTDSHRNREGFSDSTYRDPFTRQGDYRYTSITYAINVGAAYLSYLNALTGLPQQTMTKHPRFQALLKTGDVAPITIAPISEFADSLSDDYSNTVDKQTALMEQNVAGFSQNQGESSVIPALSALRTLVQSAKTIGDYDDIIGKITSFSADNDLKTYLLAEAQIAKIHYLASIIDSYPDQRSTIALRKYRDEFADIYSQSWNLLQGITAPVLKPLVLAGQFCIQKNNYMVDDQVGTFEQLAEEWNALSNEDYKTSIVKTIESYDYEATIIGASFSYENRGGEWRLHIDSTMYDWYKKYGEALDVRKALQDLADGSIDDLIASRVYRYFELGGK